MNIYFIVASCSECLMVLTIWQRITRDSVWYLLRAVVYETDVSAAVQLEQSVDVSLSASESYLCPELGRIRMH
jgi:hypothetical protein